MMMPIKQQHLLLSLLLVVVSINEAQGKSLNSAREMSNRSRTRSMQEELLIRGPLTVKDDVIAGLDKDDDSSKGKGTSQDRKDKNYERRKKRKDKKKDKKCKGEDSSDDISLAPGDGVSGGKGKAGYDYVDCSPSISPAPTITGSPTWSPTISPVPTTTAFPSKAGKGGGQDDTTFPPVPLPKSPAPVLTPFPKSPAPVLTPFPTQAPVPSAPIQAPSVPTQAPVTSAPTLAPVTTAPTLVPDTPAPVTSAPIVVLPTIAADLTDACEAIEKGEVYSTDYKYKVSYFYELVTPADAEFDEVVDILESKVAAFLAAYVVPCARRRMMRRQLTALGVGPGERDAPADGLCTALTSTNKQECYLMEGTLDFYVSEGSTYTQMEAAEFSYTLLEAGFNKNANLVEQPFLNEMQGISGLFFHGTSGNGEGKETPDTPAAAAKSVPLNDSNSLGGLGLGIIVAACVSVMLVGVFAMKRRSNQFHKGRGVPLGDGESIVSIGERGTFDKMTDIGSNDDSSFSQASSGGLPGKILSDDDSSIFTGLQEFPEDPKNKFEKSLKELGPIFVSSEGQEVPLPSVYANREYATPNTVEL